MIKSSFGYNRGWNFRSKTGFTALGLTRIEEGTEKPCDINGVIFQIEHSMLADFDRREDGYDRIPIPSDCFEFLPNCSLTGFFIEPNETVWVYVPKDECRLPADEDHPILQSYVDTVMQGCLYWGNEEFAEEFVRTTSDWSPFFLNDTPSSRRPWLFRQQYNLIDNILQNYNHVTHFSDRRHPEEFASAFLTKMMRGAWSVPMRNSAFTGREKELGEIHARITAQRRDLSNCSIPKLHVVGMGGIGKSQLCIEYCYRYFPSYYGLVIWLSAPSAESIAAGFRQLMFDTNGGMGNLAQDKDTDEIVSDVKARLYRSTVPWLLVFDNLEDYSLLDKFVPNGSLVGHVLITTRLVQKESSHCGVDDKQFMFVGCFSPEESVELLCRAAGERNVCSQSKEALQLAIKLGHLPLALGMAAAYMRKCDVDCSEYLARYSSGQTRHLGHEVVSSSLSLSLDAIKKENVVAWEALRLLCWVGPDQISKKLIRSLFEAMQNRNLEEFQKQTVARKRSRNILSISSGLAAGCLLYPLVVLMTPKNSVRSKSIMLSGMMAVSAACMFSLLMIASSHETNASNSVDSSLHRRDVFELSDTTWTILKSFSLLVVKEGQGSIHRLLAQALREDPCDAEEKYCLDVCLNAILQAWKFKSDDPDTWQEAATLLDHLKTVVTHTVERHIWSLETAKLSREAGVFAAMALNRFAEAQASVELSLQILEGLEKRCKPVIRRVVSAARATSLHELGRVLRYEGKFSQAENALSKALQIRTRLSGKDQSIRHDLASTLHELGVLKVREHNLDPAAAFLEEALRLRRQLELESPSAGLEAHCASTLHQLAAIHVARKPPSLDLAESLLLQALGSDIQIGQRAATLRQLARICIRRGEYQAADNRLKQALELYAELYGEYAVHINIAAVKFQQGTLAFQREQYDQAWDYFSECLRVRRKVYSYSHGNHIEVSIVLHELACVALAQGRTGAAREMLTKEKDVLNQLFETSSQHERLLQALLTNLTWLRKCAKELGMEEEARLLSKEQIVLKRRERRRSATSSSRKNPSTLASSTDICLQEEALQCRTIARQYALANREDQEKFTDKLKYTLANLCEEMDRSTNTCFIFAACHEFHQRVSDALMDESNQASKNKAILKACDELRNQLRGLGIEVTDVLKSPKRRKQ